MTNLTRYPNPGKYEGELAIVPLLHALSLDGWADNEIEFGGGAVAVLLRGPFAGDGWLAAASARPDLGLTAADLAYCLTLRGVILHESSDGFVSADYFTSVDKTNRAWRDLVAEAERYDTDTER